MKVSVRKISEITGFSPATVSNALNRKRGVNKETAERILAVAEEMGYVGENRITKIKFVIFRRSGSIIDDSAFHPAVIEGVERCAKEMGYETVFCNLNSNDAEYEERVREILSDTSGAVVLLGTEMLDEDYELYENAKCRIILLDGWNDEGKFDGILIDNTDSACRAMEYLVRKGHREIGYLQGDFRIKAFQYRRYGFERVCQKYNLPMDSEYTVTLGTQIETAYQDMRRYLKKKPKLPTAYFAENDVIALGAMRALREEGIRVPEDVSVIGFDDISYGLLSEPPLTTVHVYKQEMGELAVRTVLEKRRDTKVKRKIQVCTDFVERGSVKEII